MLLDAGGSAGKMSSPALLSGVVSGRQLLATLTRVLRVLSCFRMTVSRVLRKVFRLWCFGNPSKGFKGFSQFRATLTRVLRIGHR